MKPCVGVLLSLIALMACQSGPASTGVDEQEGVAEVRAEGDDEAQGEVRPKRIILFIGDGMGVPAVTAASYAAGGPLAMLEMPAFGLMTTHEYEYLTTDSAASATAIATGAKTHFEGVAVAPGTGPEEEEDEDFHLRSIFDAAQEAGWKTGLVATTRINHATPAPFAANRHQRHQYEDIALDMSKSGVDVFLGAGSQYFEDRQDERDLFQEMEERGYRIARTGDQVREAAAEVERLVGLMHPRDMPWVTQGERAMELEEMVDQALAVLDRGDPPGFVMMVEGSFIDWAGHAMDGENVVVETLDMDRAVRRALEYARRRDDTLVVVTSDHETGAMDVIDGPTADRYLKMLGGEEVARSQTIPDGLDQEKERSLAGPFALLEMENPAVFGPALAEDRRLTTSFGFFSAASRASWDGEGRFSAIHTPVMVPIFAEGPGAMETAAVRDNADLGRKLMDFVDGQSPPAPARPVRPDYDEEEVPKNVVLFVADGLGPAALTAGQLVNGPSSMMAMERAALVSTHGADRLVNGRFGAATALATGQRTHADLLGLAVDEEGRLNSLPTVWHRAREARRKIGLVTNTELGAGVAPAFFARHEGGAVDSESLAAELSKWNADFVASTTGNHRAGQTLAGLVAAALDELGASEEGFLLVVDGSAIGDALDEMDRGEGLLAKLAEFEMAVALARSFAASEGQTLVLATATRDHTLSLQDDHYGFHRDNCGVATECGGPFELIWHEVDPAAVAHAEGFLDDDLRQSSEPPKLALQYTWLAQRAGRSAHAEGTASANFVPLFAEGPGAAAFGGFMDLPEVGQWLIDWANPDR